MLLVACTSQLKNEDLPATYTGLKEMVLVSAIQGNDIFYIDVTPITYQDFRKYVKAGGSIAAYWDETTYNKLKQPVTGINWYHAVDYCNWRSKMEGLSPAYVPAGKLDAWGYPGWKLNPQATGYRLPTEAQFMVAARNGQERTQYPWGDAFDARWANYDDERGVKRGKWWRLALVDELPKNARGIRGMSGNIWHWCDEWYATNRTKVLKGGSWGSIHPDFLKIDYKTYTAPSNYNFDIGFRCVRPAVKVLENNTLITTTSHLFYQYQTSHKTKPTSLAIYDEAFTQRLASFLGDYFPQSLYFQEQVDQQPKITPLQLAQEIVTVTRQYRINPLFLTAIMVSESGVGSCSFPRWYNNPMAYHWQNRLMNQGLPRYNALPGQKNRKYKTLREAFHAFCKGIRRDIYYRAASENLYDFHMVYVGYESDVWLYTIARVFKDVAGIRFEADEPMQNAGAFIYMDWKQLKRGKEGFFSNQNEEHINKQKTNSAQRYYLIAGSYTQQQAAQRRLDQLKKAGFAQAKLLQSQKRIRVAWDQGYATMQAAKDAKKILQARYSQVWIWRKR